MTYKPLQGIRVVELASIGPGPFACMMLADHGADIIRIEKPGGRDVGTSHFDKDPLLRGRRKICLDLKRAEDVAKALDLIKHSHALIEGFRPGVTERLGLGPKECQSENPALVYARMTGWGQTGPLSKRAGHDINYIALTGALDAVGTRASGPVPPLNLVGDFGGGGMLASYGICAALLSAQQTGRGTVIDAAMVEGTALLMAMPFSLKAQGKWDGGRGNNLLDGGAPFYGTFKTSDDKWVAIGAIEEPFWQELIAKLDLEGDILKQRFNQQAWPQLNILVAEKIAGYDLDHWVRVFEGSDACFAPVLSMDEVQDHEHNVSREIFQTVDGVVQPAPAPRYNGEAPRAPATDLTEISYDSILDEWSI